jgi:hypothetical protein
MFATGNNFRPFEMPTTLQAFPHCRTNYFRNLCRAKNVSGLWRLSTEFRAVPSWIDLGKRLFNQVLEYGGIWHLYGHSWEIDDLKMWSQVTQMLDYVSHREEVLYLTNGELLSLLNARS